MNLHVRNQPGSQHGIVLFTVLIALVVLSLASVALVRSIDTGTTIAGNLTCSRSSFIALRPSLKPCCSSISAARLSASFCTTAVGRMRCSTCMQTSRSAPTACTRSPPSKGGTQPRDS